LFRDQRLKIILPQGHAIWILLKNSDIYNALRAIEKINAK